MSARTIPAMARMRTVRTRSDFLLLLTVFVVTFEQIHWEVGVSVALADVVTVVYLLSYVLERAECRDWEAPRTSLIVVGFTTAFLLVYLVGFYNIQTTQGLAQFGKGMAKLVIHLLFVIACVSHLTHRTRRFYWIALSSFFAGIVANAAYGIVQLLLAHAGFNLDSKVIRPLTGGASSINIYGAVGSTKVYRPNALTGDPNHLAIMMIVPLLVLTPLYLRLERRHRLRLPLAIVLGFLLIVELATLSRSGALGLAVGFLLFLFPYRRRFLSGRFLVPLGLVVVLIGMVVLARRHFFETVLSSRLGGTATHFSVYNFIPKVLSQHPLLGLGLNNFSVYYQFVTGKTNWGPHSFYVALLVEGGLIGATLFAVFLWYVFRRLAAARRIGRSLVRAGDPLGALVRPLSIGMTAALLGTMASNAFYLTMQFYYFYAFVALCLALPLIAAKERALPEPALALSAASAGRSALGEGLA
ncbi:MAG: O-antigen ligase family protein [Gaiellaceae bacterium]